MDTPFKFEPIQSFETLKLLSDPRRMDILKRLMVAPATLSQLGRVYGITPARIRHHLKRLESTGLIELASTNINRGFIEKYYRASAQAYQINLLVTPLLNDQDVLIAMGSDDPAMDLLAEELTNSTGTSALFNIPVGSLDGLIALRQGLCHVAGCHLWDATSEDYNISYLSRIFPDREIRAFTVSERIQGLFVRKGNPKNITAAQDLTRPDITFINRKKGSGTRLWINSWIMEHEVLPTQINGFERTVTTHREVAQAVANQAADVGVGVAAVGGLPELEFITLFQERFDLIIDGDHIEDSQISRLLDHLHSSTLRGNIQAIGGYETALTGNEVSVPPLQRKNDG